MARKNHETTTNWTHKKTKQPQRDMQNDAPGSQVEVLKAHLKKILPPRRKTDQLGKADLETGAE